MSARTQIQLIVVTAVVVVGLIGALVISTSRQQPLQLRSVAVPVPVSTGARPLLADSRAQVTVTEFLDFECEACGALYPIVEQLRKKYRGKVEFRVRYFPLPSHLNSVNAARAAEAAARQGKFSQMYKLLFSRQALWAEQPVDQSALFRSYAESLDLDLGRFDRDLVSTSVADRIEADVELGRASGVAHPPTFYVGDLQVNLRTTDYLVGAIEAALAS